MNPVLRKMLADIRRRKVQTAVVALVVLLSSLTATLALTLLAESDAPFDRAFNRVQGAHLFVAFDTKQVTETQVRATGSLAAVAAAAGPWLLSPASIALPGGRTRVIPVAGYIAQMIERGTPRKAGAFDPRRAALYLRRVRCVLFVPARWHHRTHGGIDLAHWQLMLE